MSPVNALATETASRMLRERASEVEGVDATLLYAAECLDTLERELEAERKNYSRVLAENVELKATVSALTVKINEGVPRVSTQRRIPGTNLPAVDGE